MQNLTDDDRMTLAADADALHYCAGSSVVEIIDRVSVFMDETLRAAAERRAEIAAHRLAISQCMLALCRQAIVEAKSDVRTGERRTCPRSASGRGTLATYAPFLSSVPSGSVIIHGMAMLVCSHDSSCLDLSMKRKTVYLNDVPVGTAQTWHEVAALLRLLIRIDIYARDVQNHGNEGPDGFYIIFESGEADRGQSQPDSSDDV